MICLEITENSKSISEIQLKNNQKIVLVVGSERNGIQHEILTCADSVYHIPMYGQNSSMNVAQEHPLLFMKLQNCCPMLNLKLLKNEVQHFINEHLNTSIDKLALKGSPFDDIQTVELLEQIQSKKKCEKKLPNWYNTQGVYFPYKINIEQTSSEISATYKSNLITGKTLLDLTVVLELTVYILQELLKTLYIVKSMLFYLKLYNIILRFLV